MSGQVYDFTMFMCAVLLEKIANFSSICICDVKMHFCNLYIRASKARAQSRLREHHRPFHPSRRRRRSAGAAARVAGPSVSRPPRHPWRDVGPQRCARGAAGRGCAPELVRGSHGPWWRSIRGRRRQRDIAGGSSRGHRRQRDIAGGTRQGSPAAARHRRRI